MREAADDLRGTGVRLSYDGRRHALENEAGTWTIRLELEQLGAGEMIGVGSIWTAFDAPHDGLVAEVIVSGRVDRQGIARVALTPLAADALAPVTLVLRLVGGHVDGQEPLINAVLEVRGLPAAPWRA